MSRVRFATAQALFEAFPEIADKVSVAPTDERPILFLNGLVTQGKLPDAVAFCAYLLPRREAVWWACRCARSLLPAIARERAACLAAAEAWVGEPDDAYRQKALDLGSKGDSSDPLTWLALAAGWTGGLLSANPKRPVPMPPYMTARAARIAVILSAMHLVPQERTIRLSACIAEGIKLAESGVS
jgi:hypothetical protein